MELVHRIMLDMQQDYFAWVNETAMGRVPAPEAPTFELVTKAVRTFRCEGLSPMPAAWHGLMNNSRTTRTNPAGERTSPRQRPAAAPQTYDPAEADASLFARFRDSNLRSIGDLLEGHEVAIPKQSGTEVCLTWVLKGQCTTTCKRARRHVAYTRATNTKIHQLLTTCGVANPQE